MEGTVEAGPFDALRPISPLGHVRIPLPHGLPARGRVGGMLKVPAHASTLAVRAGELEPTLGFEPRTCCLRNSCSTAELCRRRSTIADALGTSAIRTLANTL